VTSVGTKDPGLGNLAKAGDRLRRKVGRAQAQDPDLRTAGILVAPPRRRRLMRRLNAAWVERQLRRAIAPWPEAVAWVRWPTPELVVALGRLRPRVVVYECVDAYHAQPGMRGAWQAVHDGAERALVALADVVVTPSEPLAERFRAWGADVRVIPHGVDLPAFGANGRAAEEPVTVGFVGTLDYKLDIPVLRAIADAHPEWRLRLIGPVQEGFDPGALAHLPNVTIEPPVPPERVSELNASFDVGLMPYFDHPAYYASCPLKNLEYMAVGKPAVARPAPALEPFADTLRGARRPAEFVAQLERALAEDTPERARARRAVAEANTWDRRLEDFRRLLDELTRR
jgi:glycosyltransferase involved in cell wall biosynthesis